MSLILSRCGDVKEKIRRRDPKDQMCEVRNDSTTNSSLSYEEVSSNVQQFRERMALILNKYPSYDTVFTLERWLRSYDNDIEEAAKRMTQALQSIDALDAYRDYDSAESLNEFLHTISRAADYFPGGIMGPDKHGNIILLQPMGRARPKTMMRLGRVSDLYRASVLEAEACMSFLRKEEAIRGHQLSIIFISDLAELSLETIYMPAVKAYMNVINILQYLFPNSIKKVYVINSPGTVSVLFKMAKQVLSQRMIENIEFVGSDWKQRLKDELGEENIFRYWGGTKKASKETGTIRMGGEVPASLSEEILKTLKFVPDDQLTKATIPASGAVKVPVQVSQSNSILQWYFTISSGDIDFKITFGEEEEIWPHFRLSTEFVPEYGELLCSQEGTYILHFDSPAKLFSKIVAYNVSVKEPGNLSRKIYH
uniref:CRAL-TRIO domain-containing protein n=1 Tax=Setaria digitata TaxID=48799 RepID=A0A915Q6B4_9BILA